MKSGMDLERQKYSTVIMVQGTVPRQEWVSTLLEQAEHLIVCDGAIRTYVECTSRRPDIVIGDGDSVEETLLDTLGVEFIRISDQETNDLTKGVMKAKELGWDDIAIIGATGRREDHTLGNIFLLAEYLEMNLQVCMLTETGIFIPFKGSRTFEKMKGYKVSFFDVDRTKMTAKGVLYPFRDRIFTNLWQGTLNTISDDVMEVCSEGRGIIYFMRPSYECKK